MKKKNIIRIVLCMLITLGGAIAARAGSEFHLTTDFDNLKTGGPVVLRCNGPDGEKLVPLSNTIRKKSGTYVVKLDKEFKGTYNNFEIMQNGKKKASFYKANTKETLDSFDVSEDDIIHFSVKSTPNREFVANVACYKGIPGEVRIWNIPSGNVLLRYDGPYGIFETALMITEDSPATIKFPVGRYRDIHMRHELMDNPCLSVIDSVTSEYKLNILGDEKGILFNLCYRSANEECNMPHMYWDFEKN